jgi:RNA polymerase sigma-70 factor, ECF subfamily
MESSNPPPAGPDPEITRLLRRWQAGEAGAREQVVEAVYEQVRIIARQSIRGSPHATLGPTDLAHEALIRLLGADAGWRDRHHLYNVLAQATRQILVDGARRRLRDKRGGGQAPVSLSQAEEVALDGDASMVRVDDALAALAARDPRRAQVVEMTYFGGFSREEIAQAIDVSGPTVDRDLRFGRAWLKRALEG